MIATPRKPWPHHFAVTPQPSTKHLTDEELKLQYGIHLTSRIQSDGEGKEAKWADIDDDEDDWAPETIEWGDGTKTTVNPADNTPADKSTNTSKPPTPSVEGAKPTLVSRPSATFATSIGPNATVLKVGASAERQQAQKAAQAPKGPVEKTPLHSSQTTPAPPPSKSPWAKLPPVDKASPVEINPQVPLTQQRFVSGQHVPSTSIGGLSPAQEISADDFNRTWRDSPSSQPRELFMPGSGQFQPVSDSRRRASRNEQGFRAPAVLQRPGAGDPRAPEPSAAFQTNRTSSDARRRASSTVSGGSGQMARRMSFKSTESPLVFADGVLADELSARSMSQESQPVLQTPTYQAFGGNDPTSGAPAGPTDAELEAQRAQQKIMMRDRIEQARKRKAEEEAKAEAEKQERIRQKLASLGPDPRSAKAVAEETTQEQTDTEAKPHVEAEKVPEAAKLQVSPTTNLTSPPKPPQPLAGDEPQQYGMMKVHPVDSVKKAHSPANQQPQPVKALNNIQNLQPTVEDVSSAPPVANGARQGPDNQRPVPDSSSAPEPVQRNNRPVSVVAEARASWGRNDHRSPPTNNLWGLPNNKALGNGTFDQMLAGYAPQDLSSRASSTGQGWMNGRTPTIGQSPQMPHATQHVPETRSQALQSMTSPEPQPLTVNSEVDSLFPVRPPAPIGPPQAQQSQPIQPTVNGYTQAPQNAAVQGWNNFGNIARVQDRADSERFQRELAERREEEKKTGVRQQANYNFNETFKQVQLGDNPSQRHVSNVAQASLPSSNLFGAVGSLPPSAMSAQSGRGSRFFPQNANGPQPERRAVTYTFPEIPRSPSPPPAEEEDSFHPAYELPQKAAVVRLPPAKAIVKLPPADPPTPPSEPERIAASPAQEPSQPMTWAARLAMPAPKPATFRAVSTPIVQNPSWQERFNGLLGKKDARQPSSPGQSLQYSHPSAAIASVSKEPLDVMPANIAVSVSLPQEELSSSVIILDDGKFAIKDVEDEEDLFEDREAGSLPIVELPTETPAVIWPRPLPARVIPTPPDTQSAFIFMGSHWKEDKFPKQQFAIIRPPGSDKSVKRDLPMKTGATISGRPQSRHSSAGNYKRGQRGGAKPRPIGKTT